jgi:hypothetical protein
MLIKSFDFSQNNWALNRFVICVASTIITLFIFSSSEMINSNLLSTIAYVFWVAIGQFLVWQVYATFFSAIFGLNDKGRPFASVIIAADFSFVLSMISYSFCVKYWFISEQLQNTQIFGTNLEPLFTNGALTVLGLNNVIFQISQSVFSTLLSWGASVMLLISQIGKQNHFEKIGDI